MTASYPAEGARIAGTFPLGLMLVRYHPGSGFVTSVMSKGSPSSMSAMCVLWAYGQVLPGRTKNCRGVVGAALGMMKC